MTEEPIIDGTIVCPKEYMGPVIKLCQVNLPSPFSILSPPLKDKRGQQEGIQFIDEMRVVIRYRLPLQEVIMNFYDQLKSVSSGYATYDSPSWPARS